MTLTQHALGRIVMIMYLNVDNAVGRVREEGLVEAEVRRLRSRRAAKNSKQMGGKERRPSAPRKENAAIITGWSCYFKAPLPS
jgi:hypothetical protein